MAATSDRKHWCYWSAVLLLWIVASVTTEDVKTTPESIKYTTETMDGGSKETTPKPLQYEDSKLAQNTSRESDVGLKDGIEEIDGSESQGQTNMFGGIGPSEAVIKPTSTFAEAPVSTPTPVKVEASSALPDGKNNQSISLAKIELSLQPSHQPSLEASVQPSVKLSLQPSVQPSLQPSVQPSHQPMTSAHIKPTPIDGISTSVPITSSVKPVVNTQPLDGAFSTLHSAIPSALLDSSMFSVASVALDNFSAAQTSLPITELPFSEVSEFQASSRVITASVTATASVSSLNASETIFPPLVASDSPSMSSDRTSTELLETPREASIMQESSTWSSSAVIQASSTLITASSVQIPAWMLNDTLTIGSTMISPSPTAEIFQTSIPETTEMPYVRTWHDSVYQFVFEGNCTVLFESRALLKSFIGTVKINLAAKLSIPPERVYMGNIRCGSVVLNVTIEHTDMTAIDDQILELIASASFRFSINTTEDTALVYQAVGVKVLLSPSIGIPRPSSNAPEQAEPFEDSLLRGFWELSEMERILIIVFSVLGGFLFILAVAYIVHLCCLRGQSKSFDLGDTPDHQVKLEDFTLTKLQRPPTIYDEHGMILTEDLNPGQTKMAVPYLAHGGHTCCHGHVMAFKDSPTLTRRANHSALHGSSENLVTHVTTHQLHDIPKDTGIDNMSFSSDDILGDGDGEEDEDPTDIETDDDLSPARRPQGSRPSREKPRHEI